jgi:restriction system protein
MDVNIILGGTAKMFPAMFFNLWPILVFALGIVFIKLFFYWLEGAIDRWRIQRAFKKGEQWRSKRELIQWMKKMKPAEFEEYIADVFSRMGYDTQKVGSPHDGGVDVVAKKDGTIHYIQCKKFISSKVSVSDVRDFYGALADRLADGKGMFITTNVFTLEAERFAEDKPIELIDGDALARLVVSVQKDVPDKDIESDTDSLTCPECGGKLVERKGRRGRFYGCSNYPKCRYTRDI